MPPKNIIKKVIKKDVSSVDESDISDNSSNESEKIVVKKVNTKKVIKKSTKVNDVVDDSSDSSDSDNSNSDNSNSDNSNSDNSDSDNCDNDIKENNTKKGRPSKDILYKNEQIDTFENLKILLKVKQNGSFTDKNINDVLKEISTDIYFAMKKFYPMNIWRTQKGNANMKCCLNLIKNIAKHHKYIIFSKEMKDENKKAYTKYFMVPLEE
jgi:hypothetical protein